MRTVNLIVAFPQSAESADELGLLVVLIDETRAVAVAHVDVAVRSYGNVGWPVDDRRRLIPGLVRWRLYRIPEGKNFFALQGPLGHKAVRKIAQIKKLFASLFLN